MHAKPDLRVFLKWTITRSGSVITAVILLTQTGVLHNLLGRTWEQLHILNLSYTHHKTAVGAPILSNPQPLSRL
jgi:hypothetical protein